MKKFLLTLCMTMLAFVTSWAQWAIDVSTAPVYVEVQNRNVGAGGTPNVREFTITTPAGKTYNTDFTIQAVEVLPTGGTANKYATAAVTHVSDNNYKVTFSPVSVGITHFYLQITEGSTVVSSTAAVPFEVNVFDMTKARFIINPGDQKITKSTSEVVINFAPVSAATTTAGTKVESTTPSTNTGTLYVGSSLATKDVQNNLVSLTVNASSADEGDKITVTITPPEGSVDRNGNAVQPVTFTLTVGKPEFPITYNSLSREFRVGENWTSPLYVDPTKAPNPPAYSVSYTITGGYPEDVIQIHPNTTNPIEASLTAMKVGHTQIWAVITPEGDTWDPWIRPLDITVREALLQPILSATRGTGENVNKWTPTLTVNIDPNNKGDGNAVFTGDLSSHYTVEYSLEGEIPGTAEVDPATGVVTVTSTDASQVFYLVATVTPNKSGLMGGTARTMISVTGENQGAHLYQEDDGSWVAYLYDPSGTGTDDQAVFTIMKKQADGTFVEASDSEKPDMLNAFKQATDIKVMGTIKSFNIRQLAYTIGCSWSNVPRTGGEIDESKLKKLDMSGCIMTDCFDPSMFPVNRAAEDRNFVNVKEFVLPKPAIGVPNGTVLPAGFNRLFTDLNTNSYSNIQKLVIPEGWTEIADGFSRVTSIWGSSPFTKLTDLKLPNTMEKIGNFAFSGFAVKVLTMPYNIHRINEGAFATSPNLQDVYFTGPAPEFVHTLAFSGVTQMCNNTTKDQQLQGKLDPDITRYEYYNGTDPRVLACILHFPEQYRSYYTDVTREYRRLTQAEVNAHNAAYPSSTWPDATYSKGYKTYVPEGWTSAFIQQVQNKKIDWNAYVSSSLDFGVKDAYYGLDMIWPSQSQMSTGFAIAQAGYQWSGQPLRTADQYNPAATYAPSATDEYGSLVDRRGLYQFIIAMGNADIHLEFELGKWYTIALPFNMTVEQIQKAFGPDTQVCRFSKVTRVTEGDSKQIKLEFRKSVMGDIESGDYCGTEYNNAKDDVDQEEKKQYNGYHTGIIHHFPYMIKPSGTINLDNNEYCSLYDDKYHFNTSSFERLSGTLHDETLTPSNGGSVKYVFAPILSETKIKPNSYVLIEDKDYDKTHKFAFYKGKKSGGVYVAGGRASQNTAYVQLSETDGKSDYSLFFESIDPKNPQNPAKMFSFFGDDYDDAPTAVEKVVIECGQDQVDNGKIYTINGQLVSGSHLPAGIYIKNGKKILVK